MDCLVEIFNSHNIIDERDELLYSDYKRYSEMRLIKRTTGRYNRYISGIDIWQVGDVSYDYIRQNIMTYLSIQTNQENIPIKLKWMEIIDNQIKDAIS
jgi:hypothetical protein